MGHGPRRSMCRPQRLGTRMQQCFVKRVLATIVPYMFISHTKMSILLTAWPWAKHGSCFAQFLFICFFSVLGDHYQTSTWPDTESRNLWCLYAKNWWNSNKWEILWILLFYSVWNIFSFGFIKVLDLKGIRSCLLCQERWSLTHWSQTISS